MDALSEALQSVRMTAAIFYNAEYTAPWGDCAPPASEVAPTLAPGFEHVVVFHLVTEGRALAQMEGQPDLPLTAGDIVIFPHGHAHRLSNGAPQTFRSDDSVERGTRVISILESLDIPEAADEEEVDPDAQMHAAERGAQGSPGTSDDDDDLEDEIDDSDDEEDDDKKPRGSSQKKRRK